MSKTAEETNKTLVLGFVARIDLRANAALDCSKPSSVHHRPGVECRLPC
jgi:hypothetical protein